MRLLYCIPSLNSCGGTERVLTTKLNYLSKLGTYELYVVVTEHFGEIPYFNLEPNINIINLEIGFSNDRSLIDKIKNYHKRKKTYQNKLLDLLKTIRPNIVTSYLSHEIDFLHELNDGSIKIGENHFNRNFRFSFVKNNTSNYLHWLIAKYRDYRLGQDVKKLDALVSLTQEDAAQWGEIVKKIVIPNPLSFTSSEKSKYSSKRIIAVGRLSKEKGFDILLEIWSNISLTFPNWKLDIFGEGEELQNLLTIINRNKLERVQINAFDKQISKQYIQSDIFVLTSRFEGFGLVIIEAMECGLPVVAFDCKSGPKEIISDSRDGFIVSMGNIGEFSSKLSDLMRDENIIKEMGKNAILKAQEYKIDNIMKKWIDLYNFLIQGKM